MERRTVEHWWNGNWGTSWRRDVWLETEGRRWYVRVRDGQREGTLPGWGDEATARAQMQALLDEGGRWKRID